MKSTFRRTINIITNHQFNFPNANFQIVAFKSTLQFFTYSEVPLLYHSPGLHHQHIAFHWKKTCQFIDNIYHNKKNGDNIDHWHIHTLRLNACDSSESTLIIVFAPSYRLITDVDKFCGIPFFFFTHLNTLFGALSKAFPKSTKHMYQNLPFHTILIMQPSQNECSIKCSSLRHEAILHLTYSQYSIQTLLEVLLLH